MPKLTFTVSYAGPIICATFALSKAQRNLIQKNSGPILRQKQVQLLVDTGADGVTVDEEVAQYLGAQALSVQYFQTDDGSSNRPVVELCIDVKGLILIDPIMVSCAPRGHYGSRPFKGLLGRSVLDLGQLTYDGPGRSCTLDF